MRPPSPTDLLDVAAAGPVGLLERSRFRAPLRLWTWPTLVIGLFFAGALGAAALVAANGRDLLGVALVGAVPSWLILSLRLALADRALRRARAETAAADAVPVEAVDRVVMAELAGSGCGAAARLKERIEHHRRAGQVYEMIFWTRVLARSHAILRADAFRTARPADRRRGDAGHRQAS